MRLRTLLLTLGLFLCTAPPAHAESNLGPFGVRGGVAVDGKDGNATQLEGFGVYQLPWGLRSEGGWGVSTNVELTAGVLRSKGEYGAIGSLGPTFWFNKTGFPLVADLGISVGILSRDRFGTRDYNGIEQFISHGALIYRINHHLGLSYRFQHMSNAGLNGKTNPGLNMHLFGVSWYLTD